MLVLWLVLKINKGDETNPKIIIVIDQYFIIFYIFKD
jgi:hypothetical protein